MGKLNPQKLVQIVLKMFLSVKKLPAEMERLMLEKTVKAVRKMLDPVLLSVETELLNQQKPVQIVLKMLKFVKKHPVEMGKLRLKLENNVIMDLTMEKMENVHILAPL